MTTHDSAHEDSEDRFYAQFDSREVELMTLDELQAAFEAGQIHENTFVCREGDSEWLTLADVAGLGEEQEPEPAPVLETRPPMPSRRPELPAATETRPPMPSRRPPMNTVPAARFQEVVPTVVVSSTPLSFAPVSSNIDYPGVDMDDMALRPKRRWGLVLAAAAVLALAGGGTVFALNGGGRALASAIPSDAALQAAASKSQASLTLSNIEAKPSEPAAPVLPSTPAPVAVPAPADPAEAPKAKGEFTDDMKQALLAADKKHQAKHVAKAKARATASAPRKGKALSTGGFKSGGSAYDPLNGKL